MSLKNKDLAIAYSVKRKPKKMSKGGEVESLENNLDLSYVDPADDLLHDEHEDFLTDHDAEDPFNDIPEHQHGDMHEGSDEDEHHILAELMKRRRRAMK